MSFRCISLLKMLQNNGATILRRNCLSTVTTQKIQKINQFKTENNTTHFEDPDTFGTLAGLKINKEAIDDEGDLNEEKYLQDIPLQSQKLTIKQYADIIKQYVEHKRINEAIDVLETRMLKIDRVQPVNYIYNILIGACADVGYTKKAFQLYNDMKRRALKPTGDTYTCLFEACINSPWPAYGLKKATHLRNLMIEKNIEPNLTNFNVMIKTFGRCSDLPTAFKIVDEMISKQIKIRSHTFNHLLQACISDKESGLKYALKVWRKMLKMKQKPNLFSFNLMLKCVKDCNLGTKEDLLELIEIIEETLPIQSKEKLKQIECQQEQLLVNTQMQNDIELIEAQLSCNPPVKCTLDTKQNIKKEYIPSEQVKDDCSEKPLLPTTANTDIVVINQECDNLEVVQNYKKPASLVPKRTVPNLLSRVVHTNQVLAFQNVSKPQDKFAIIGGQEDFLKEMEVYSVKPDIKTFTQMLAVIEESTEAENKLIEKMKSLKIKTDIDFYNMLIKKRCLRMDYDGAFQVTELIEDESRGRKRHPFNKKYKLNANIMTYGTLALACNTREKAEKLLNEMKEKQLKVNIEIMGALLKNASINLQFAYVLYIMDAVKVEKLKINHIFLKHLETFNERCVNIIKKNRDANKGTSLEANYDKFNKTYNNWLKEVNVEEALKPEHPWTQFREAHPKPVQREKFQIVEPKMFHRRKRNFIPYTPRIK